MNTHVRKLRIAYATCITILIFTSGCHLLSPEAAPECPTCEQAFEIHLNNSFDQDRVRVGIDGELIFDERVTTEDVWSLAEIIELRRPIGTHHLKIIVNDSGIGRATFELDRPLFIHVRYYREAMPDLDIPEGVVIEVSERRTMYD